MILRKVPCHKNGGLSVVQPPLSPPCLPVRQASQQGEWENERGCDLKHPAFGRQGDLRQTGLSAAGKLR
ncbi:MAG: hypothetical protein IAE95_05540 [Chitinophagaceae bacterium]|nr:hypothetical protein [Chitinophagaceae bacterium]